MKHDIYNIHVGASSYQKPPSFLVLMTLLKSFEGPEQLEQEQELVGATE